MLSHVSSARMTRLGSAVLALATVAPYAGIAITEGHRHHEEGALSSGSPARVLSTYLSDLARNGYSPADTALSPRMLSDLTLHWALNTGSIISDQPAVANSVVYFGTWSGYEYAVSTSSGSVIWRTYLGRTVTPIRDHCSPSTVGVASSATVVQIGTSSEVITGTGNGEIAALNAVTGRILWTTRVAPRIGGFVWSSPAVFGKSAYIGVSSLGDCPLVPGQLVMLSLKSGRVTHAFTMALPRDCSGDGIWSSPAIDTQRRALFVTTGNANTSRGLNCYSPFGDSVLELSTSTLQIKGHWHVPRSLQFRDADFGATPTLFTAMIGRHLTSLVGAASKDGMFYALRRGDLKAGPVWSAKIATAGPCPECAEGSISSAAFDGATLYVAGGKTVIAGKRCRGSVRALDPATGRMRWADCLYDPVLAAVTETPGVIYVDYGPELNAVSSSNGQVIFKFFDPNAFADFYGPVGASGDTLYVGNADGYLRAFSPGAGSQGA